MNSSSSTLPLTVENTGFLLDRLGQDCHPLQFLRELTQNAIEAIQRAPQRKGDIRWDVDWTSYELGKNRAYKLCIVDNGVGMTGPEMVRYINQLSSSTNIQSVDGNYGVGAKIAAATRNHAGLIYLSWKDGRGAMIHLWRDPSTGMYGLRQIQKPDGTYGHYGNIEDEVKPDIIDGHGTKIILYGNSEDADTMQNPPGAASPSQWIAKYLNSRYFRFPQGITVRARQGWEQPRSNTDVNLLRTLTGQQAYLAQHQESAGQVNLTNSVAHWWILKDDKALGSNSGFIESAGHCAALYRDELYELASGRAGHVRLQQFGVIFGQRQVVIYVEPVSGPDCRIATNTSRTQLLANNEPLPWTDWAAEFRNKMPQQLQELIDRIASKSADSDHVKSIRDRLKSLMDLFKVSRYRPTTAGSLNVSEPDAPAGGPPLNLELSTGTSTDCSCVTSKQGGSVGGIYSSYLKKNGSSGAEARPDLFPKVKWVSTEHGTRELGNIEDKAARYLEEQNLLLINSDFRVFSDMVDHWQHEYQGRNGETAGLRDRIKGSVHNWYEQALVETVIGVQALRGSREWSDRDLRSALSEEALTGAVMQRYHPYKAVKRELGTAIGSLNPR